jgi:hypothetical protein
MDMLLFIPLAQQWSIAIMLKIKNPSIGIFVLLPTKMRQATLSTPFHPSQLLQVQVRFQRRPLEVDIKVIRLVRERRWFLMLIADRPRPTTRPLAGS